jgi:hypothetical protein
MNIYAGIGSRKTPKAVLSFMREVAVTMYCKGWHLRSGGAAGADMAFWHGYVDGAKGKNKGTIYRPEDATPEALAHAEKYHPNWGACSDYVKRLHARNSMILFGANLDEPVEAVICWTPNGAVTGGTGQALRIALANDIMVFNLANPASYATLCSCFGLKYKAFQGAD